ncbi:hypothetical protein B0H67DRAFT_94432 [Lasiosphaeris hirsuta]|uniref:Uncharacterized protein n=1 Tax=Lasiosphaeris hirsuta TaxID=260670 RepID=A0AA40BDA1_9PEZI|nr:hypothetical protein B0H67DRAFT_94432 [Lasiosphaeris hirsuta]
MTWRTKKQPFSGCQWIDLSGGGNVDDHTARGCYVALWQRKIAPECYPSGSAAMPSRQLQPTPYMMPPKWAAPVFSLCSVLLRGRINIAAGQQQAFSRATAPGHFLERPRALAGGAKAQSCEIPHARWFWMRRNCRVPESAAICSWTRSAGVYLCLARHQPGGTFISQRPTVRLAENQVALTGKQC